MFGTILISYLSTIIISEGISTSQKIMMIKDCADAGYKFKDINNNLYNNYNLYPFINIILSYNNYQNYIQNRYTYITEANYMKLLEEFTNKEKELYEKHPTILNALLLKYKMKYLKKNSKELILDDKSSILYKIKDNDIDIIESNGPINRNSLKSQKLIIIDKFEDNIKSYESRCKKNLSNDTLESEIEQIEVSKRFLLNLKDSLKSKELIKKKK